MDKLKKVGCTIENMHKILSKKWSFFFYKTAWRKVEDIIHPLYSRKIFLESVEKITKVLYEEHRGVFPGEEPMQLALPGVNLNMVIQL
jgi:hypothetical protein